MTQYPINRYVNFLVAEICVDLSICDAVIALEETLWPSWSASWELDAGMILVTNEEVETAAETEMVAKTR